MRRIEYVLNTPVPDSPKKAESSSVSTHTLRLTSDAEQLEKLSYSLSHELVTDVILNSLSPSNSEFIVNCQMQGMDKSLQELKGMLRINEGNIENRSRVLMIQEGGRKINKAKRETAIKYKGKGMFVPVTNTLKINVSANFDCYYCK